jgi:hypothetical protein
MVFELEGCIKFDRSSKQVYVYEIHVVRLDTVSYRAHGFTFSQIGNLMHNELSW